MISLSTKIYGINDIDLLLDDFEEVKSSKKITYLNVSASFDIEVSSFYKDGEKQACMYAFVFGINGKCIIGRTWDEFMYICNYISNRYMLDRTHRLIVYVHNLAYEFQFIQHLFHWEQIFALEKREPVKCVTTIGIEFRCSYLLSGYSLAHVGKNLHRYKIQKMVGDLDYSLIRHSKTKLTDKELGYILHDGLVVMAYIQEKIEDEGNITFLPLTKTGYVRKYCRKQCLSSNNPKKRVHTFIQYRMLMSSMQIQSVFEYQQLKRAFQGGFTHANAIYSTHVIENVGSYDECSAYPYAMVSEQYPMGKGKIVEIHSTKEFLSYLKYYCCLFDITFIDLESTTSIDHPISFSKIRDTGHIITDNGRVVSGDKFTTTITEQDFLIYRKFYKWKQIRVKNMIIYKKGYLPTPFVKSILDLYIKKTELKGVEGKEVEYMNSKEQLNSCYGMCVTDICRDEIVYDENGEENWSSSQADIETELNKYNASKNRFLFYPWGVWVTAYARKNLFGAIYEFGTDYCYSDTDSVKGINVDKHIGWINAYNKRVYRKLVIAMEHHHLDLNYIAPKTKDGRVKVLGQFECDGVYKRFKTYGAKRYMYEDTDNNIKLVVSGLNRQYAVPYLKEQARKQNKDIFDMFNEEMYIPREFTGKNIHTYLDETQSGIVTDYLGNEGTYFEYSSIHMEGCEYSMSLADDYIDYLKGIKDVKM